MILTEIHSDNRGSISILTGFDSTPEITVFRTKMGYARGGCIHNQSEEFCCVIEGRIEYNIDGSLFLLKAGDNISIGKSTPHYFTSLTDSIVLEWGAKPEEKKQKHIEFRAIVDNINLQKEKHNVCTTE